MLRKVISSILIIIILLASLPVEHISKAMTRNNLISKFSEEPNTINISNLDQTTNNTTIQEDDEKEISTNTGNIETIDLTGIVAGTDLIHTHIYESKYDETNHWQECWICHNKKDIQAHTYNEAQRPVTCNNPQTRLCTHTSCEYREIRTVPHTRSYRYYPYNNRAFHREYCANCNTGTLFNSESGYCVDSSGNQLGCKTGRSGTCAKCGQTVNGSVHGQIQSNGRCENCNIQLFETTYTVTPIGETSSNVSVKIKPLQNNLTLTFPSTFSNWNSSIAPGTFSNTNISNVKDSEGCYNLSTTVTYDKTTAKPQRVSIYMYATIDGFKNLFHISADVKTDNYAPERQSITFTKTVPNAQFDRKATITAVYTDNQDTYTKIDPNETIQMQLWDKDKTTFLKWADVTRNSSTNTYTHTFDLIAEIREPENVYLKVFDNSSNYKDLEEGAIQVQYIDALAPRLTGGKTSSTEWSKNKEITYTTEDKGIGQVQIGFNNENNYALATQDGDNYSRTFNFIGDVTGSVEAALYLKDGLGNNTLQRVTISNIDNTAPTITQVNKQVSENKKSETLTVVGNDYNNVIKKEGSGIKEYAMSKTNTVPDEFQTENTFTVTSNGTYYIWAKDQVGNISQVKTVTVDDLEINISGNITWNDLENAHNSRIPTILNVYKKVGENGIEELAKSLEISAGQTNYNFQLARTDNEGNTYTYRIEQQRINGYETSYSKNNVISDQTEGIVIDITNTLILPNFTSNITYTPIDSFEDKYLKNGLVKLVGEVSQSNNDSELVGINNGIVTFVIDEGIEIDESKIIVKYYEKSSDTTHNITNYTLNENILTVNLGKDTNGIGKKGDKITIETQGNLGKIGEYSSNIKLVGKLTDYRGTTTTINLGELTNTTKEITAGNQLPKAKIQIEKRDSITEEKLKDVTFTLYEWNGNEYIQKETITDVDGDGIYVSKEYEWNSVTQGKYKIEETVVSPRHKDLKFSMEFNINQLKGENYTIKPDYTNGEYIINYGIRRPDDFDNIDGIVENEPWKLKAEIKKVDSETGNIIQSETEFTIYEWNKESEDYEEYTSYTTNEKVNMIRQEDKTYLTGEWLYYTSKNEGKYRIIETKSPEGYYANYQNENTNNDKINATTSLEETDVINDNDISENQTQEKVKYDINIAEIIENGKYKNQVIENEGTIKIEDGGQDGLASKRVKATLNVDIVDKETRWKRASKCKTRRSKIWNICGGTNKSRRWNNFKI